MTDTTSPGEHSQASAGEQPAGAVPHPEGDGTGREAAKYRRQLRETEAQRDALAERLERHQRAEVERLAGARIEKGSAIWAGGAQLADFLDADGNVDPLAVPAAVDAAIEQLGLSRAHFGPVIPSQGDTPEHRPSAPLDWSTALSEHGATD
jgi:hypothetical protein